MITENLQQQFQFVGEERSEVIPKAQLPTSAKHVFHATSTCLQLPQMLRLDQVLCAKNWNKESSNLPNTRQTLPRSHGNRVIFCHHSKILNTLKQ